MYTTPDGRKYSTLRGYLYALEQLRKITQLDIGIEEGAVCNRGGCTGVIELELDGLCCCGAVPAPCSACENAYLACAECDAASKYEDEWNEQC